MCVCYNSNPKCIQEQGSNGICQGPMHLGSPFANHARCIRDLTKGLELERRKQDLGHIRQQKQILVDWGGLSQIEVVYFMEGIRKQSSARNADVDFQGTPLPKSACWYPDPSAETKWFRVPGEMRRVSGWEGHQQERYWYPENATTGQWIPITPSPEDRGQEELHFFLHH